MTTQNPAVGMLHDMRDLFEKTASRLEEGDADFRPRPEMMSVAERRSARRPMRNWTSPSRKAS
jgi:hypothetical protein